MRQQVNVKITLDVDAEQFNKEGIEAALLASMDAKAIDMDGELVSIDISEEAEIYENELFEISVSWHIEDVKHQDSSLSDDDARKILEMVEANHDCNVGINWEVIDAAIDDYKQRKEQSK